jgi:hypothetical protein
LVYQSEVNGKIIVFFDIIHRPFFYLKQLFGNWILSPSSGKNVLCWAQSIELFCKIKFSDEIHKPIPRIQLSTHTGLSFEKCKIGHTLYMHTHISSSVIYVILKLPLILKEGQCKFRPSKGGGLATSDMTVYVPKRKKLGQKRHEEW